MAQVMFWRVRSRQLLPWRQDQYRENIAPFDACFSDRGSTGAEARDDGPEFTDNFAKVVEAKSFSEAARLLKMPTSTISRRVAELEGQLGVRLLERSTRSLRRSAFSQFPQAQQQGSIYNLLQAAMHLEKQDENRQGNSTATLGKGCESPPSPDPLTC